MICEMPIAFPLDDFNSVFPVFSREGSGFSESQIMFAGQRAMHHISPVDRDGIHPLGKDRMYALFLMTAHILTLDKNAEASVMAGQTPSGGAEFKATIGSVTVERTKPNSFTMDDWAYWLTQTSYGQELIALLEEHSAMGFYINSRFDSVRVLK